MDMNEKESKMDMNEKRIIFNELDLLCRWSTYSISDEDSRREIALYVIGRLKELIERGE